MVDGATVRVIFGDMTAEDTRVQVERLVRADPTLSAAQIARALKISRQRVHKILTDRGWRLNQTWEPPPPSPETPE